MSSGVINQADAKPDTRPLLYTDLN